LSKNNNMESAIFHLNSNELDQNFLEKVKSFFKNERIKVIVMRAEASVESDTTLLELIEKNDKSTFNYQVPAEDFKSLVAQFRADEQFDIAEAIATYKTEK
jgi:hypothetical protein